MPPAKRSTKKTAKKSTKKRTLKKRTMSASHKKALAEGRRMSSTIDQYVRALNAPKRRGRQVTTATLRRRLGEAQARMRTGQGLDRVLAAQEARDLKARLARPSSAQANIKPLETAFVKVAKKFSASRGITYGAWRDAGVPADVLRRAGIARTRD
jgi:hypothetical protein